MRLFIAIPFTDEIRSELQRFQSDLRRAGMSGRFSPVENLHLTLAFIGEYPDPQDILDIMEEVSFRPFDIKLSGFGNFGDLYWAGIEDCPGLAAYVRRLRRALAEHDIPFDRKKFSPHITLVRRAEVRNAGHVGSARNAQCAEILAAIDPPAGAMHADHIVLMRSDRGKNGMIYTELGGVEGTE
ncbi:MAG: RNA 2',3'-cyclic phosphodiesterase [Lachnospiraceae bacterium]|nr:RNA 2',3'-cyclic phosphodiesterase [Lachnospiraceae bacterium]